MGPRTWQSKPKSSETKPIISGIPNILVGLKGMVPGIGYLCNTLYDVTGYCLDTRKISLRVTQCFLMAIVIVNVVGR